MNRLVSFKKPGLITLGVAALLVAASVKLVWPRLNADIHARLSERADIAFGHFAGATWERPPHAEADAPASAGLDMLAEEFRGEFPEEAIRAAITDGRVTPALERYLMRHRRTLVALSNAARSPISGYYLPIEATESATRARHQMARRAGLAMLARAADARPRRCLEHVADAIRLAQDRVVGGGVGAPQVYREIAIGAQRVGGRCLERGGAIAARPVVGPLRMLALVAPPWHRVPHHETLRVARLLDQRTRARQGESPTSAESLRRPQLLQIYGAHVELAESLEGADRPSRATLLEQLPHWPEHASFPQRFGPRIRQAASDYDAASAAVRGLARQARLTARG